MIDQDEVLCHATGERRQNYLNQIRCILEQMDDTPCVRRNNSDRKPIVEYPGYVNMKNPNFRKSPIQPVETPYIVNVPVMELRPTSEYWKHAHENDSKLQYFPVGSSKYRNSHGGGGHEESHGHGDHHDEHGRHSDRHGGRQSAGYGGSAGSMGVAQRKKSYELAGGFLMTGCDCARHNGLQDDCRRTECQNNPTCKTEPPSCGPSSTYANDRNVNIQEKFEQAIRDNPPRQKFYCCCDPDPRNAVDPRGLPKNFEPFPCKMH
ncbi:uncharacterized protein [Halyomorpha halys]|uniref:uncharacterized protein n=1 Tax=Halyomorpha halys TaxID=286706 RepID=UPI0006D4D10A|nr:uncharacterized protein LOC106677533 [Halyomorpha halys]